MKKIFPILLASLCFIHSKPAKAELNPEKDILSSAIKIYKSISPEDDIKTRIKKQELVIKKIDEIFEKN